MAEEITVNNNDEFQEMVDNKDFKIASAIVKSILSNLTNKKKNILILSINCLEEQLIYDLTLDRKHFVDTLEENLKYYIEQERYEECQKIVEAINKLKSKSNLVI
jgi:protein-arginine kinase activator protein McsA